MSSKIILLCTAILLSMSAYGLHEIFQTTFQQHLQQGKFEEARKLVADEAFPEEKDELLAQITRAEIARRDFEEAQQILHAPEEPERTSRARRAPAASSASTKVLKTLYKQLESAHLEKIYDALMENDEDLALAIIMSAHIGYEDAIELLKNIVLPDFRAKRPRWLKLTPAKASEASKEKMPDTSGLIADIKTALGKNDFAQAERILSRIVELSAQYPDLGPIPKFQFC